MIQKIDDSRRLHEKILVQRESIARQRLDVYLVKRFPKYSRTLIQKLIKEGAVTIQHKKTKSSYLIEVGDEIDVYLPQVIESQLIPEAIPLQILYEDDFFLVIDKPPAMVVHPAGRYQSGTLVNALLGHCSIPVEAQSETVYRPGIVHRLDKNTSGVMVCAKTLEAHHHLSMQFEKRQIQKEYLSLTEGIPRFDQDLIDRPLGRHPQNFKQVAAVEEGKEAQTIYKVLERFVPSPRSGTSRYNSFPRGLALVKARPRTGRTHQIRVHLASIGCPVLCDNVYGKRADLYLWDLTGEKPSTLEEMASVKPLLSRQALHAHKLTLFHPQTNKAMEFTADLPEDLQNILCALREQDESLS